MIVNVFLTFTTVVLNHFAEGSQIQAYNFVREPQKIYHKSIDTFCFIALTKSVTQNIRVVTESLSRAKGAWELHVALRTVFENHCSTSITTPARYDVTALVMIKLKKHQRLADPLLRSGVVTRNNRV